MLAYEWRELETLCQRISDLRHRLARAEKTKNAGLTQGLQDDLALARRQRELLVHHISTRLGAAAAERNDSPTGSPDAHGAERTPALQPAEADESGILFGFHSDGASAP